MNINFTNCEMDKKLLVLDLDETLLHATENRLAHEECFQLFNLFVYKRPHLDWFLSEMLNTFKVGVWTASGEVYAEAVVQQLFERNSLEFVWTSQQCTLSRDWNTGEYATIKNLRKLKNKGYPLDSVIVVDDTPSKHRRNYGNLVTVKEFIGDQQDNELPFLATYLKQLAKESNIRKVEKRFWRSQVEEQ